MTMNIEKIKDNKRTSWQENYRLSGLVFQDPAYSAKGPHYKKAYHRGVRPGLLQTELYNSRRWLEA